MNKALFLDIDNTLIVENTFNDAIIPIVDSYRQQGYLILIVTNRSDISSVRTIIDEKIKPESYYTVQDTYMYKPESYNGYKAKNEWNLNLKECIMIGDKATDKLFAKKLGMKFLYEDVITHTVDLSTKTALVYDYGMYVELARRLAKDFKKVYYYSEWKNCYPTSKPAMVGYGIEEETPNFEKILDFYKYVDKSDIVIFPDIYNGDLQLYLENKGKTIWGSRRGEDMEMMRYGMYDWLNRHDVTTHEYERIKGIPDLRDYLEKNEYQHVKVSRYRGDMETFYSENYNLIEPKIDEIENNLGPQKYIQEFIVEENLPDCVEMGYDGYNINGDFPSKTIFGLELKDAFYVGEFRNQNDLPKPVLDINNDLKPLLKEYSYKGFFSTEIRVGSNNIPYLIDSTCRCGNPPSDVYMEMFENISEIIYYGANDILIDPISNKKFGMELMIKSKWAENHWQPIQFDPEYRNNIKIKNLAIINGEYYAVPQTYGLVEFAGVVVIENSIEGCIDKMMEVCESIKGFNIKIDLTQIDKALIEWNKV